MTDPVEIRPATPVDVPGIRDVAIRTWHAAYAGLIPAADVERFLAGAYRPEHVERGLRRLGAGYLVAVDAATRGIVGYAFAGRNRDGGGELFALYVLPERQGAGIGHRLWQAAADHLRAVGLAEMLVWVLATNHPAQRFYERQGARPVAERDFPVGDGVIPEIGYRAPLAGAADGGT